jgi:hypothetical protein
LKIKYHKILYYLFLFFAFLPFVSPFPIGTDTQPISIILAIIILIINLKKLGKYEVLIYFILIFFIYINPFYLNDYYFHYEFKKVFSLIGGIIIFIASSFALKYLNGKFLFFIINIYFIIDILIFFNPDLFLHIQSFIIRENNVTNIYGSRGIASLSTEPGLFAGMMVGFLLINDYLLKINNQTKVYFYIIYIEILLMIILSKSGTGYLFFLLYLIGSNLEKFSIKSIVGIVLIIGLLFYIIFSLNLEINNRGIEIIKYLFDNPIFYIQHDLSIYTRVYSILIGIKSLYNNIFGYGVFDLNHFLYNFIILKNDILYFFPKGPTESNLYLVSGFSYIVSMYGIIGLMFIIYIYYTSKAPFKNKIFSFLFLLSSYSIAFPLIWILLNLQKEYK